MELWNRTRSGIFISFIALLLLIYNCKYNQRKKFASLPEEFEFRYLSTLKSKSYTQTKIIVLYTKLYNDNWGMLSGNQIFKRLKCPVTDCYVTNMPDLQPLADAVIFHMRDNLPLERYPRYKPSNQRWIFFLVETPYHIWDDYSKFNGLFDWTSTYTSDSDIPAPYGCFEPFNKEINETKDSTSRRLTNNGVINYAANKTRLALWMVSHCETPSQRESIVLELSKYLPIDVYGCDEYFKKHGKTTNLTKTKGRRGIIQHSGVEACPFSAHPTCLATLGPHFKFYLALENSLCKEYITEKFWYNALAFNMVPIVMGAPLSDYLALAPPKSFIHLDSYPNVKTLANYLLYLHHNDSAYNEYFGWKGLGRVHTEILVKPAQSRMWCNLCTRLHQPLNATAKGRVGDLKAWWNVRNMCTI